MARQDFADGGFYGKVGDVVGQRWHNKRILRGMAIPKNPQTPAQTANREVFKHAVGLAQQAMNINGHNGEWDYYEISEFSARVGTAKRRIQAGLPDDQAIPLHPDGYTPGSSALYMTYGTRFTTGTTAVDNWSVFFPSPLSSGIDWYLEGEFISASGLQRNSFSYPASLDSTGYILTVAEPSLFPLASFNNGQIAVYAITADGQYRTSVMTFSDTSTWSTPIRGSYLSATISGATYTVNIGGMTRSNYNSSWRLRARWQAGGTGNQLYSFLPPQLITVASGGAITQMQFNFGQTINTTYVGQCEIVPDFRYYYEPQLQSCPAGQGTGNRLLPTLYQVDRTVVSQAAGPAG